MQGFLCYCFRGLIFGGAYFRNYTAFSVMHAGSVVLKIELNHFQGDCTVEIKRFGLEFELVIRAGLVSNLKVYQTEHKPMKNVTAFGYFAKSSPVFNVLQVDRQRLWRTEKFQSCLPMAGQTQFLTSCGRQGGASPVFKGKECSGQEDSVGKLTWI